MILNAITPGELAQQLGWSEKRVRRLAKSLGACRVLGNRMTLLPEDVDALLKATKPCPSSSTDLMAVKSGTTAGLLPAIDYEDLLARRAEKRRRRQQPKSKASTTNIISMDRRKS